MSPLVVILTWCGDIEALYGSLLTFKTLRVGFPDSEVVVFDNASTPEAVPHIKRAAKDVGAVFVSQQKTSHGAFIRQGVEKLDKPVVFADPDLVFWRRFEMPDALMSGRLIPAFHDEFTGCDTAARLHTSLLCIPRPRELAEKIKAVEARYWEADLWRAAMYPGPWTRHDTGAGVYAALGGHAFTDELNSYDHLFCGSNLQEVADKMSEESRAEMVRTHAIAKTDDLTPLRGIWRKQQQHFEARSA